MLNQRERYGFLRFFRICCVVLLFPVEVDLKGWQLKKSSTSRRCICFVAYGYLLLQALYKIGSLAYTYLFEPDVQMHQLLVHVVVASAAAMCTFWYYQVHIRDPALFAVYFKMTVRGNIGGPPELENQSQKRWTKRLREYSLQDLTAIYMPFASMGAIVFISATFVYDPSIRLLLYAALPTRLQIWATLAPLALEEFRLILVWGLIATTLWQLHVISFDLVINQLHLFTRTIERRRPSSKGVYKFLRSIQLYVIMLNDVNCYLIFTCKLLCISASVLSGYAAIAHFWEHPLFGIMYYVIIFDLTLVYTVMYGKAFKIPRLYEQVCACAALRKRDSPNDIFKRQMLSIPRIGIKVGNFHTMERASTLIFIDFVVTNIVAMLVAYG